MKSTQQLTTESRPAGGIYLLIFVVLAVGIISVGYLSYHSYVRHYRVEVEHQLAAVAELKMAELTQWRKERLGDGYIFQNTTCAALVRRVFETPIDAEAQGQLQTWLGKLQAGGQYDRVRLLDTQGRVRLSIPADQKPIAAVIAQRIPDILQTGQMVLQDFYRSEDDQRVHLAVLVPVLDETAGGRPLGVLTFCIDPDTYLYPFIKRWPTPSRTAETLLVRREGDEVVYLNELRFQTNTALNLRVPLSRTALPAAKAVLGVEGGTEGIDYRGVPVVAALRTIPDSPWSLVARMDAAEVYAPLRERLWHMGVLIGALLFGAGACVGLVWRQQRIRLDRVRHEAEAARLRLSAIVESSDDAISSKSLDGIITSWNAGAERLYGYSAAEAIGKPVTMLIPSDLPNEFPQLIGMLKRGETVKHYETVRLRKNGERIAMSLSLSPVKDPAGAIVGASVIGREITERKRAEAALRASELRYRRLFEAAKDGVLILDAETGMVVDVNPFLVELLGLSRETFLGKKVWELGCFKDIAANEAKFKELQAKDYVRYEDLPLETADGRRREVEFVSNVYLADKRKVIQCNIRDISERKRAEAAQRESEQSYRALFENMLNGFAYCKMLYDEQHQPVDFVYLAVNKAFEKLTGLKDVVGKPVSAVIPGVRGVSPELFAAYDRVATSGQPERFEFDLKSLKQWLSIAVYSPARGYFVAVFDNITERKRAEAEQAKLEAQNRQLQKSESLGRMAGAIAHHYNNKLQTIMGNIELAMANLPPGTKTIDCLKDAMQAARRAADVSMQMLAYLGKSSGIRKPLYLSEVCRQYLPLLQSTMPVVLETDFAAPGPVINANANQMQQVLVNLVTNAWEALGTNRGAIRVSITTVAADEIRSTDRFPIGWQPQAGSHACLEVADAGCGIAAEEIEKIFDPFFSRKFVGRGLGLSVVFGIVKAHDGGITVESEPGRGSTFRVYFPMADQAALPVPPDAMPVPDFQAGGTVLVVEDDASVRALAAHVIGSMGFTVLTAEDGVAALEVFRQHRAEVRCVMSDLSMPRMNGWQTIAALRQLAPGIPVILVSGYDEASVMAEKHPDQPQVFLGKPYNREDLRTALGRALAVSQPRMSSS